MASNYAPLRTTWIENSSRTTGYPSSMCDVITWYFNNYNLSNRNPLHKVSSPLPFKNKVIAKGFFLNSISTYLHWRGNMEKLPQSLHQYCLANLWALTSGFPFYRVYLHQVNSCLHVYPCSKVVLNDRKDAAVRSCFTSITQPDVTRRHSMFYEIQPVKSLKLLK